MAFSQRFAAKAKPKAAAGPPTDSAQDADEEEMTRRGESERAAALVEERRQQELAELSQRRQAAFQERRRAEEEVAAASTRAAAAEEVAAASNRVTAAARSTGGGAARSGAFAWKKGSTMSDVQAPPSFGGGKGGGGGGGKFGGSANSPLFSGGKGGALMGSRTTTNEPSLEDAELAVQAIMSKTAHGMKEGLETLGLPSFPLVFVPGQKLILCGRNVREEVNGMIHAWMTNDNKDFYKSLKQVKAMVDKPLLTEEEYEFMDGKEEWVRVRGPDGAPMYAMKGSAPAQAAAAAIAAAAEEEDDDEVIDVTPAGVPVPAARSGAATSSPTPPQSSSNPGSAVAADVEDYYAVLGVEPGASLQEIRAKFRGLVVTHHPEKGGDVKHFQKLNKAYSVLSDQRRRQDFDQSRAVAGGAGSFAD